MSTCTHKKSIRHRLLATCWTTIMRKSSCDLKTNKRTRIKGEGPRRRLKIYSNVGKPTILRLNFDLIKWNVDFRI